MLDAELLQILNQIPGAIEKAFTAFIERHPGHGNQKTHGNRFGAGQAKESLRRLKDDKGARESYKQQHRERGAKDLSKMSQGDLHRKFSQARTANQRAGIANEMLGRGNWKDSSVASSKTDIPKVRTDELSPRVIGARGKNAVFLDDNGTYGVAPVVLADNDYFTGALGRVRRVKPEFVESKPKTLDDVLSGLDLQHDKIKAFQRIYSAPKSEQSKLMNEFLAHNRKISQESGRRSYDIAHGRRT